MNDPANSAADSRLRRAYHSLEGLSCGDAFGERFFIRPDLALSLIEQHSVPAPPWIFTDDTMMAMSIVETLEEHHEIRQEQLAQSFARNYDPLPKEPSPSNRACASSRHESGRRRISARRLCMAGP
jgi:ADP-ribosylglycohydrolase